MRPLCGHVLDTLDERDRRWGDYAGAVPARAELLDLREHAPPVSTQIANNCCAHALRAAAYATAKAAGKPIPLPSCAALYAGARLQDRQVPLKDLGSSLRAMCRYVASFGFVSEKRYPEVPAATNAIPPADVLQVGQDATLSAYYRISPGPQLADGIVSALQRLRFPVFAMIVDEVFAAMTDGVYAAQGGAVLGSHAMLVVGFDSARDAFLVLNSWGQDFGDRGYVWIARAIINRLAQDAWVLDVVPGGAP